MISTLSMIFMVIAILSGIAIPVVGAAYLKKKYKLSLKLFLLGCIIFFTFTIVLEALVHNIILGSVPAISGNPFLFALYGGLMAGIFEETGRLFGYKYFCRKNMNNDRGAFMYGIGHGGFEAFYILFTGMISYLIMATLINSGNTSNLTNGMPDDYVNTINETINLLIATPAYNYIIAIVERLSAVCIHLSLSVLVWFAVKKDKYILYALAILAHAVVDFFTSLLSNYLNEIVLEIVIMLLAAGTAYLAHIIWKREHIEQIVE